jgi:hypothetical protein
MFPQNPINHAAINQTHAPGIAQTNKKQVGYYLRVFRADA